MLDGGQAANGLEIDLAVLGELTLNQIDHHWTDGVEGLREHLSARKEAAYARKLEVLNERNMRELISRDYVRTHIFGTLDALNRRLLGDMKKTITRRLYAMAAAGESIEQAEAVVHDLVSHQLKGTKQEVRRRLQAAQERPLPEAMTPEATP